MALSSARVNGVRHVLNGTNVDPEGESQGIRADWAAELYGVVSTLAGLPSSGNWVGRQRWVTSERNFYVWMGSSWVPVGGATSAARVWSGTVTLTSAYVQHSFPAGVFTSAPNMSFAVLSGASAALGSVAQVSARDKDGFTARAVGGTATSVFFMYTAIQTP